MLDVIIFQLEPLPVLDIGSAVAGPPAGNAGLHTLIKLQAAVRFQFALGKRARPDQAHIRFQQIQHLRQLIHGCLPQKPAGLCDPRVIGELLVRLPFRTVCFILQELFQHPVRIRNHCAEFVDPDDFAVLADALLRIKNAFLVTGEQVCDLDCSRNRNQQHQSDQPEQNIQQSFEHQIEQLARAK